MLLQIAVGSGLLLIWIRFAALAALALEIAFARGHGWLLQEPHRPKLVLVVAGVTTRALGVIPPHGWRILAAMAAANGFLNFGLLTALLVEALRHVRLGQTEARRKRSG